MICSHCGSSIPGSLLFCPVCGSISDFQKTGPSFEKTWADISIAELKKKPDEKTFRQPWDWLKKDLKQNPQNTLDAAAFLEAYPQFTPDFSDLPIDLPEFANLLQVMDPGYQVLLWGISKLDGASIYAFCRANPGLSGRLLSFLESRQLPEDLQPFCLALKGDPAAARTALRNLIACKEDQPLMLTDPFSAELFGALAPQAKERLNDLARAREAEDLEQYLQDLYRPLADAENPFAHLENPGFRLEEFLSANEKAWKERTIEMLEQDTCLRGIHLAAQTIKSAFPSLAQSADEILAKQYEKAYMRPYSEIEQTDFAWR